MTDARADYDAWHDRLPVDLEAATPWHTLVRQYLDLDRDARGRRVLEIGCGRGGFALWLARAAAPECLAAADFSLAAVRRGLAIQREPGGPRVLWEVGDIQRLSHPDATFDTVISTETVEHLPNPRRGVAELARVLKPGGRLFLTTPNYLGPMGLYRIYLRLAGKPYTEEGQPINRVTMLPRTLRWVRGAGLRVTAVDGVGHYLPLPGAPPRPVHWLNRARALTRWFALHSFVSAIKP